MLIPLLTACSSVEPATTIDQAFIYLTDAGLEVENIEYTPPEELPESAIEQAFFTTPEICPFCAQTIVFFESPSAAEVAQRQIEADINDLFRVYRYENGLLMLAQAMEQEDADLYARTIGFID